LTRVDRHLFLCNGSSCLERGSADTTAALRAEVHTCGLHDSVHTTKTLCNGRCDDGPVMIVQPDGVWYKHVNIEVAREIVRTHLARGESVEPHVLYRWGAPAIDDRDPTIGE